MLLTTIVPLENEKKSEVVETKTTETKKVTKKEKESVEKTPILEIKVG